MIWENGAHALKAEINTLFKNKNWAKMQFGADTDMYMAKTYNELLI